LKDAGLYQLVPKKAWKQEWVCDIKAVGNGQAVLKYLAPYVYRVAISDRNILDVKNDRVTFQYKNREDKSFKKCTLNVFDFLRGFLQHVLPKGFVKIRYFGLLATKKRKNLDHVKEHIGKRLAAKNPPYPEQESYALIWYFGRFFTKKECFCYFFENQILLIVYNR